jgi:hypothetical protein
VLQSEAKALKFEETIVFVDDEDERYLQEVDDINNNRAAV